MGVDVGMGVGVVMAWWLWWSWWLHRHGRGHGCGSQWETELTQGPAFFGKGPDQGTLLKILNRLITRVDDFPPHEPNPFG